jgi:Raf kinase inhibitor-like YbhB/YbcL family protein
LKVNLGTLTLSAGFPHGGALPPQHSVDGPGMSPALAWSGVPAGTGSFAIVVHDPDAPLLNGFTHWVLYGIPASVTSLVEGGGAEFVQGLNGLGETGWRPAAPPPNHGAHHYFFHIFALSEEMPTLPSSLSAVELLARIEPYVLEQARVVGTYERHAPT